MAPKSVLKGLQMLFTAAPSLKYSPVKLTVLTYCHRLLWAVSLIVGLGPLSHPPSCPVPWELRRVIYLRITRVNNTRPVAVDGTGGRWPLGPMAALGWGGCKDSLRLRVVGWSLIRSTYSTEPRSGALVTFPGFWVALTYFLFLPKLVKCISMGQNQIWKSPPFPTTFLQLPACVQEKKAGASSMPWFGGVKWSTPPWEDLLHGLTLL